MNASKIPMETIDLISKISPIVSGIYFYYMLSVIGMYMQLWLIKYRVVLKNNDSDIMYSCLLLKQVDLYYILYMCSWFIYYKNNWNKTEIKLNTP